MPCSSLLYCQHQTFREKSKKFCFSLCKASPCSHLTPKTKQPGFVVVLRAENGISQDRRNFFFYLGTEPSFWASQSLSLFAGSLILFSLISTCDLSIFLPQGNLPFCRAGTPHKARSETEITPSSLYFHSSASLCNQQLCLYQLESLPSS